MDLRQRFAWRGRDVAWDSYGSGPAVVFCHGTPWSSQLWAPYAAALCADFTVYLWDMPGYGQSSKLAEHPVDLGVQGELFEALLAAWGLDAQGAAPHVVAHDFGGAVSLRALLLHGATYRSLCLVDVVALRPWGSDFFRLVREHADVFAAQPSQVHRGALEAYISSASHLGLTAEQLDMLTTPWVSAEGQAAFYAQIAQADQRYTDEVQDRYAEIDLPVHVVWGNQDTWIPVERAAELQALIPGATVQLLEDAGHLIQLDAPVQLAVALQRWLATADS